MKKVAQDFMRLVKLVASEGGATGEGGAPRESVTQLARRAEELLLRLRHVKLRIIYWHVVLYLRELER
jgi:hypothetical protein